MDIERARFNMIEQQIRPWDVLEQSVLESLARVQRERFVPQQHVALAFSDLEIPLTVEGQQTSESMFSPKVEARFLQALAPKAQDRCLEIGAGSGYMAALLAHHARHVISVERLKPLADFAAGNLARAGVTNVEVVQGNGAHLERFGSDQFNCIALSGSVDAIPVAFTERLAPGGRLVAIRGERPVMQAILVEKSASGAFIETVLFETLCEPLREFPRASRFTF
jgi:protein-L-isoaspartate(D-aspartate) O-methyltransferase